MLQGVRRAHPGEDARGQGLRGVEEERPGRSRPRVANLHSTREEADVDVHGVEDDVDAHWVQRRVGDGDAGAASAVGSGRR